MMVTEQYYDYTHIKEHLCNSMRLCRLRNASEYSWEEKDFECIN